jgi:thiamine pyrophosphate-dependent acetolactate synthase large subunit-like protein
MNLGSLATIGWTRPANLIVVVWDNQSYATTGGQDTATAHGADLAAAARAMGIRQSVTVWTESDLRGAFSRAMTQDGPWVIVAKVDESAPSMKPPLDCVLIKNRFMSVLK